MMLYIQSQKQQVGTAETWIGRCCFTLRNDPSSACHEQEFTLRIAGEKRRPSEIRTADPFEVAPEPNVVAHITEQNSPFPWQQKTESGGRRGKYPFKAM